MSTMSLIQNNSSLRQQVKFSQKDFKKLSKLRIIQKNLVHVQGFQSFLANKELLMSKEYFGQYGTILKIVTVTKDEELTKPKFYSAYITYSTNAEAALCILSVDSIMIDGFLIRAFFGTTKYCTHFLNNLDCYNKEKCMFLHYLVPPCDVLGAESKFGYLDHIRCAKELINFSSYETKNYIKYFSLPFMTVLPTIKTIYNKEILNGTDLLSIQTIPSNKIQTFYQQNSPLVLMNSIKIPKTPSRLEETKSNNSSPVSSLDYEEIYSNNLYLMDSNCQVINKEKNLMKQLESNVNKEVIDRTSTRKNIKKNSNINNYNNSAIVYNKISNGVKNVFNGINNSLTDIAHSKSGENLSNKCDKLESKKSNNMLFRNKKISRFFNNTRVSVNESVSVSKNLIEFIDELLLINLNSKINKEIQNQTEMSSLRAKYRINHLNSQNEIVNYLFDN